MGTTARGTTRTLPSKIAGGVCIELCTLKFYGKPANLIVVKVLLVEWLETCLHSRVTCAETHLFGRSCTLATLSKAAGGIWRVSFATDPTLWEGGTAGSESVCKSGTVIDCRRSSKLRCCKMASSVRNVCFSFARNCWYAFWRYCGRARARIARSGRRIKRMSSNWGTRLRSTRHAIQWSSLV